MNDGDRGPALRALAVVLGIALLFAGLVWLARQGAGGEEVASGLASASSGTTGERREPAAGENEERSEVAGAPGDSAPTEPAVDVEEEPRIELRGSATLIDAPGGIECVLRPENFALS